MVALFELKKIDYGTLIYYECRIKKNWLVLYGHNSAPILQEDESGCQDL